MRAAAPTTNTTGDDDFERESAKGSVNSDRALDDEDWEDIYGGGSPADLVEDEADKMSIGSSEEDELLSNPFSSPPAVVRELEDVEDDSKLPSGGDEDDQDAVSGVVIPVLLSLRALFAERAGEEVSESASGQAAQVGALGKEASVEELIPKDRSNLPVSDLVKDAGFTEALSPASQTPTAYASTLSEQVLEAFRSTADLGATKGAVLFTVISKETHARYAAALVRLEPKAKYPFAVVERLSIRGIPVDAPPVVYLATEDEVSDHVTKALSGTNWVTDAHTIYVITPTMLSSSPAQGSTEVVINSNEIASEPSATGIATPYPFLEGALHGSESTKKADVLEDQVVLGSALNDFLSRPEDPFTSSHPTPLEDVPAHIKSPPMTLDEGSVQSENLETASGGSASNEASETTGTVSHGNNEPEANIEGAQAALVHAPEFSKSTSSGKGHAGKDKPRPPGGSDISWLLGLQNKTIVYASPGKAKEPDTPLGSTQSTLEGKDPAHAHRPRPAPIMGLPEIPTAGSAANDVHHGHETEIPQSLAEPSTSHSKAFKRRVQVPQFYDTNQLNLLFPSNKRPVRGKDRESQAPQTNKSDDFPTDIMLEEDDLRDIMKDNFDDSKPEPTSSKAKMKQREGAANHEPHSQDSDQQLALLRRTGSTSSIRRRSSNRPKPKTVPWTPLLLRPELLEADISIQKPSESRRDSTIDNAGEGSSTGASSSTDNGSSSKPRKSRGPRIRKDIDWQLALVSKVLAPSEDYLKEKEEKFIQLNPRYRPEKFECLICFETVNGVDGSRLMNCEHSFCRDCMAGHVLSQLQENKYPILCPVCFADPDRASTRGFVDDFVFERLDLSQKDVDKFQELQLAAVIVKLDCPGCKGNMVVAREDYLNEPFITCTLEGCASRFCRACLMVMKGGDDNHTCKIDEDLEKLMKENGWRYCPGCRTPIQKESGCNHMTCRSPGCTTHFCYICGVSIWDSTSLESLATLLNRHWQHCVQFDPEPAANQDAVVIPARNGPVRIRRDCTIM